MIPREAATSRFFLEVGWGQVCLLGSRRKMKGLADTPRDPWNVAVRECQLCVHFQSIKN